MKAWNRCERNVGALENPFAGAKRYERSGGLRFSGVEAVCAFMRLFNGMKSSPNRMPMRKGPPTWSTLRCAVQPKLVGLLKRNLNF